MRVWTGLFGVTASSIAAFAVLLALVVFSPGPAAAKASKKSGSGAAVCNIDLDDDDIGKGGDDDDADEKSAAKEVQKRFLIDGTCTELSGELELIGQKTLHQDGQVPLVVTRRGASFAPDPVVLTGILTMRVESQRPTASGDLKTRLEMKAQRDTSSQAGVINLSDAFVSWAGWTVGYTDSLMNFWTGDDFQFAATAPNRTVGRISFETKVSGLKLSVGTETGVPTVRGGVDPRFVPITFEDPAVSARALYQTDDLTLHLSGVMHEMKQSESNPVLVPLGLTGGASAIGWATSTGMTLPLDAIHEDDEFTLQASYAVNASAYLGTQADLATLGAVIPVPVETRGWSALVSYHHVWSDQWESNFFASRLHLGVETPRAQPEIEVTRLAANLTWEPLKDFKIGGELGYLDLKLQPNGTLGLIQGASGRGLVGYLFANWTF